MGNLRNVSAPVMSYLTLPVLAGAYQGKRRNLKILLTHVVECEHGTPVRVLCNKVELDSMCDAGATGPGEVDLPATCPRCANKDPRRAASSAVEPSGVPLELVRDAMRDPALKGRVFLCSKRREPLLADGKVVGFVTPHQTPMGWRHGPIYVAPGYRRRGLVPAYYAAHPERLCIAFVADGNLASRRMHLAAGFVDWKRGSKGQFMKREPVGGPARGE